MPKSLASSRSYLITAFLPEIYKATFSTVLFLLSADLSLPSVLPLYIN